MFVLGQFVSLCKKKMCVIKRKKICINMHSTSYGRRCCHNSMFPSGTKIGAKKLIHNMVKSKLALHEEVGTYTL